MLKRPDLFIIGAAKCGTTSVYEWLKGHPEVYMSPVKEPRYFAPDLNAGSGGSLRYGPDLERYLSLFADAGDVRRAGEASVRYIYSREAPRLIHDFEPQAYIVAMVRDPVEMVYSMHNQRVSEGSEAITDFAQALAAEADRREGRGVAAGVAPALTLYTDNGRFAEQLTPWIETFGRERIHIIVFEDMVRDPATVFRHLLEFLDVDPTYRPKSFTAYNRSHAPRSRLLLKFTKSRVPQWIAWWLLPRLVGDRAARRIIRGLRHSSVIRRSAPRMPLDDALRRRLEDEFEPDVARLSELLGRDMGDLWWKRPSARTLAATEVAGGAA